jgi:uncharacterized protein with HEPN domain
VAFRIMTLGGAAGTVSNRVREANPITKWGRTRSLRDHPAHEYYDFRPENLWEFVQDVLPNLESKLRKVKPATESTS